MVLRSMICAGQSSSSTPKSFNHLFMDLALCTGVQSWWNRKSSTMSWYAEALKLPFTWSKGPRPTTEKQPHAIIPPPPNFRVGQMQSGRLHSPGILQNQTQTTKQSFHCSRVQWCCATHHFIWRLALYLMMWGLHANARSWKPIPRSSHYTVFVVILMPVEVRISVCQLLQWPCSLTRWSSASRLSCCCS